MPGGIRLKYTIPAHPHACGHNMTTAFEASAMIDKHDMRCLVSGLYSLQFGLTGALQGSCPVLGAGQAAAAAAAALPNFRWAQCL